MANTLEAAITLVGDKVQFTGTARENTPVSMDYFPPLGEGKGYTGLELLLLSLAGCSATSIVYLLRKMGKDVAGFSVKASGTRRDQHPTCFNAIRLEFDVASSAASDDDVRKAIRLSEESLCPVWAMLKNSCAIESVHRLSAP